LRWGNNFSGGGRLVTKEGVLDLVQKRDTLKSNFSCMGASVYWKREDTEGGENDELKEKALGAYLEVLLLPFEKGESLEEKKT